ncbi:MAG: hypothetical protein ACRD52_19765, partial [Candidatus Acidiferrales bacterium]
MSATPQSHPQEAACANYFGKIHLSAVFCYNRETLSMDLAPQRFGWLPAWFKHAVVSFGGAGLFLAAFFDSSVLSFPFLMDLLLIEICAAHKDFALYYVGMTVAGSLAGCLFLYFLAKRGGEKFYRRRTGKWSVRIRK